jgi:hypothetical protein
MTEAKWLACTDPQKMLEFLWGKASERKLRLFAVAAAREKHRPSQPPEIIEVAERFADGLATLDEIRSYWLEPGGLNEVTWPERPNEWAFVVVAFSLHSFDAKLAPILHDILGNPFRSASLEPAWLSWHDGLLVSMARQMYESRDFSDMPILADALEEAGCTSGDILAHCRSGGEHVRGCWVIDLLLGKS